MTKPKLTPMEQEAADLLATKIRRELGNLVGKVVSREELELAASAALDTALAETCSMCLGRGWKLGEDFTEVFCLCPKGQELKAATL